MSPLSLRRDERNQHSEAVEADQVGAEMREAASTVIDGKMTIHDSGPDQHLEASTRAQPEEVLKSNPSLETSPGKEGKLVFNAKSAGLKNIGMIVCMFLFVMEIQICFELGPATDQKCVQMIPRSDEIQSSRAGQKAESDSPTVDSRSRR